MTPDERQSAPIKLNELIEAFEFVSVSELEERQAFICRRTGRFVFVSEGMDLEEDEEVPEDLDEANYYAVPHRRDLELGRRLALAFVQEELPGSLNKAREIFSRRGAYGRFKDLLRATGTLEKWYAFEEQETEAALREWCDDVGLPLSDS